MHVEHVESARAPPIIPKLPQQCSKLVAVYPLSLVLKDHLILARLVIIIIIIIRQRGLGVGGSQVATDLISAARLGELSGGMQGLKGLQAMQVVYGALRY